MPNTYAIPLHCALYMYVFRFTSVNIINNEIDNTYIHTFHWGWVQ